LLRVCGLEDFNKWDRCICLIDFTYYNNFHSSVGMTPYEALYVRNSRTHLCWFETGENLVLGSNMIQRKSKWWGKNWEQLIADKKGMLTRKDDLLNFEKVVMYSWRSHQQLELIEWWNRRNSLPNLSVRIKFLEKWALLLIKFLYPFFDMNANSYSKHWELIKQFMQINVRCKIEKNGNMNIRATYNIQKYRTQI